MLISVKLVLRRQYPNLDHDQGKKVRECRKKTRKMPQENAVMIGYPMIYCIYTVMWAMELIKLVLKLKGLIWGNYTCSYQANEAPGWPPDSTNRKRGIPPKIAALMVALSMAQAQPRFMCGIDRNLRHHLRRYRSKGGMLMTGKLSPLQVDQVQSLMQDLSCNHIEGLNNKAVVIDTGCSRSASAFEDDFIEGTLVPLREPFTLSGIAGSCVATHQGKLHYEVIDDDGKIATLQMDGLLMKDLGCRLYSPQMHFSELSRDLGNVSENRRNASLGVFYDCVQLKLPGNHTVTVPYDSVSYLPVLQTFGSVCQSSEKLALLGNVTLEQNQNLTFSQKLLLKWHYKLGHVGFNVVKWIGRQGLFGKLGEKMGAESVGTSTIKCSACQYGKQERNPKGGSKRVQFKDRDGVLKRNKLNPGDLVFTDQFESRLPGQVFTGRGTRVTSQTYKGGTIFCDAATGRIKSYCQSSFTAEETIQSKLLFEAQAQGDGVTVKSYSSDNGVYQSKDFMNELIKKGQGVRRSGVGGHHHNGVAECAIKNVSRTARTIMIHAALRWPEVAEKRLWPLAFQHAIHLHNNTPNIETGLKPEELWTKTKGTGSALVNAHVWGSPVYVLDPRSQDGGKLPRWEPRSRQGQYVGASPLHASTVALVRNFRTGNISPQFHVVHDDHFETVSSTAEEEPQIWEELLVFNSFRSEYDREEFVPPLADEWLSDKEIQENRLKRASGRHRESVDDGLFPSNEMDDSPVLSDVIGDECTIEREPASRTSASEGCTIEREPASRPSASDQSLPLSSGAGVEVSPQARRYPLRVRNPDKKFTFSPENGYLAALQHFFLNLPFQRGEEYTKRAVVKGSKKRGTLKVQRRGLPIIKHNVNVLKKIKQIKREVFSEAIKRPSNMNYVYALLLDPEFGILDGLMPQMLQTKSYKATKKHDPDTPPLTEALSGRYREEFLQAMKREIDELQHHNTWTIVAKRCLAKGTNVLPGTWALKIKRYPDGRLRKFKARFCVRGDRQIEGVDYDDKFAPVVSWGTVRLLSILSINQGWVSRQVDFSNAFVQAPLKEDIYINLPQMFSSVSGEGKEVMKLNRSLYGLVQAPLYWYRYLTEKLGGCGLKPSLHNPCLFYGENLICLAYVDDCIFFSKDYETIDRCIGKLRAQDLNLTVEQDVHAFLGVQIKRNADGSVEMTQSGLIQKILNYTGMTDCNAKGTPSGLQPLGTDSEGKPFDEEWEYARVVGMLMYLSSNTRPDIQFAVHQCARFTHVPRGSHAEAIKRICRYLQGTKDKGIIMKPKENPTLDCYADADFAGLWNIENDQDPVCVKSRTGYVITLGGCPVIWVSKLQTEIAVSTLEAEYIALSQAMRQFLPMKELLTEIVNRGGMDVECKSLLHSTIFEDNAGAKGLASSPRITPRTKHIGVKYHFFRDKIGEDKGIVIKHIETENQLADCLTKGLSLEKFSRIREWLQGW